LALLLPARLGLPASLLEKNHYIKVVAKKIKGFSNEIVIVARAEFDALEKDLKDELFESLS
jgi:hypothetical protein